MPYIIKESTLTNIADAVREKTGGTDKLSPADMASAIEGISAGGGDIDALIDGSITEITSNATSIKSYVVNNCSALITVDFPKAITVGERAFNRCGKLQSANFPEATHISPYAFGECSSLNTINFPKVITIDNFAFYKCTAIKTGYFPSAVTINSSFSTCISLKTVDFSVLTEIGNNAFQSCSKLKSMIIRNNNMCNLVNSAAFSSTPIASGTGYIYVPRALVDSYKSATNWSTYANQFRALEDYTVDGTTAGELDESKI